MNPPSQFFDFGPSENLVFPLRCNKYPCFL